MVQLMKNSESEQLADKMAAEAAVKIEVEDPLEDEHGSLCKRPKSSALGGFALPSFQYGLLDEPSPLGLRLRKSPSLLDLIQMKLSQASSHNVGTQSRGKKQPTGSASGDKLKASNFPASVLRIGTWEYKSRYEGDLVAKCYFAKHKLVWEVLDGGLKNKIEIQWSDIMALKAHYPDEGPETLDVVLARQPLFFRETNPQPRKHTLWQATSDFTGGQASVHKRHYLECASGLLGRHFEKLTQCDPRLHFLSQQGDITLDSAYFEPRVSGYDDQHEDNNEHDLNREGSPSLFSLNEVGSSSGARSPSSRNDQDSLSHHSESHRYETPSPCSAMDAMAGEDTKNGAFNQLKVLGNWQQMKVPGLHPSMSMSDLVNHLENRISAQGTSSNPSLSPKEWESFQILEDINRCLFSDIQNMADSDEKSLMSRVNSLCCLLQKETDTGTNNNNNNDCQHSDQLTHPEEPNTGIQNQAPSSMSRKDSLNDLLVNLPRIASLPQFLFNISEDLENQAR